MKSLKISTLVLAFAALTFSVNAQTKTTATNGPRVSIGADAGIPTGSLSDGYNWNLGGSVQAEFPIADKLSFTINAGYNNIFGKKNVPIVASLATTFAATNGDITNIQLLPVKAGLKFFPVSNFYIQGEAGAAFALNKKDVGYTKSAAFIYAPQIGVLLPLSANSNLDLGVRYEGSTKYTAYDGSTVSFVGLRAAYSFNL